MRVIEILRAERQAEQQTANQDHPASPFEHDRTGLKLIIVQFGGNKASFYVVFAPKVCNLLIISQLRGFVRKIDITYVLSMG